MLTFKEVLTLNFVDFQGGVNLQTPGELNFVDFQGGVNLQTPGELNFVDFQGVNLQTPGELNHLSVTIFPMVFLNSKINL